MRRSLPWVALLIAVVVVAVLTVRRDDEGIPLDPSSTGPLGAKALVVLLRELGAGVQVTDGAPESSATTAVLLGDSLSEERRTAVVEWVRAGGTLLVADPSSELAPPFARRQGVFSFDPEDDVDPSDCDEPALRSVRDLGEEVAALQRPQGATGCLRQGDGYLVVVRPEGDGTVVSVGGAAPFVNRNLDEGDGAVLAATVLAPAPDDAVVAFLDRGGVGGGDRSLLDLVDRRVKDGLWQLAIAFGVLVLWRARRFGRPVLEPQPVELAGNELVVAVGNLMQRARRRDQAAEMLRGDLRRTLAERLGLPTDASVDAVAAAVTARTNLAEHQVRYALGPRLLSDDRELVDLARSVEDIRREVIDVDI